MVRKYTKSGGHSFFGSTTGFNSKFNVSKDPEYIEIDFIESKVGDHSGVEALRSISNKYLEAGKKVTLTHLSPDCKAMLLKWNPEFKTIIKDAIDDPRYHVVTDMMDAEV
jgi:SulP family sulfate permease